MESKTGPPCAFALILWPGGLGSSTTADIVDSDTSGNARLFASVLHRLSDTLFQLLLGNGEHRVGSGIGSQRQWGTGEVLTVDRG